MKSIKFKTNLKCNGCIEAIKPGIEAIDGIESWRVFLDIQDKILEVDFTDLSEEELTNAIITAVSNAGYKIEKI